MGTAELCSKDLTLTDNTLLVYLLNLKHIGNSNTVRVTWSFCMEPCCKGPQGLHFYTTPQHDYLLHLSGLHNCGQILTAKATSTAIAAARAEATRFNLQCNLL